MKKTKRTTKIKTEILALLQKDHLLTATQIVEKLHEKGLQANKTSVYRNLDSFLADDIICQQSFGDDEFLYELQEDHHDHIRCKTCGKVEETPCPISIPTKVAGYVVNHHHLTLYGICENCQKIAL